jgi:aldehyde:ferredoxin oxidoreductase
MSRFARSNVAFVDLTNETVQIKQTPEKVVKLFLGGRGLNMYYLKKLLNPDLVNPFDSQNPIIFGCGLLTGTGAPNSGRMNITCRSPESNILGDTNIGGFIAPELRYAGIDRIIVTGKADKPSYLYVEGSNVEIRDADAFWGYNTNETQLRFRKELGKDVETLCIGEAGENLVRFACVRNGVKNAGGRCGTGAVMGSKQLKAIVAHGTQGVPIKEPLKFVEKVQELNEYLGNSKIVQVLGRVGTPLLYEVSNYLGAIRTKNAQLNAFEDSLDAEEIHHHVSKMLSCYACPVHCRHRNVQGGEGPEYTTIVLLGANIGIADPDKVIQLNNLCNDLGLDVSSTGTIISWAIELYEEGIISEDLTGRPLEFDNFELVRDLIIDISKRRGFGNILAESTKAAKTFGAGSEDYLIAVKGLPQSDPHDCRYIKSFALGIATSSRGADHLRSRPTLDILGIPEELRQEIYQVPVDPDPTSYKTKEQLVAFHEDIYAVIDSLGICKFVCHGFNSPKLLKYEHFKDLIKLATGLDISEEELRGVGKRIVQTEREINVRLGISRKDDCVPKRYFDDPMPLRPKLAQGHHIDRKKFDEMLSRYYQLRGWDQNGIPSSESDSS